MDQRGIDYEGRREKKIINVCMHNGDSTGTVSGCRKKSKKKIKMAAK